MAGTEDLFSKEAQLRKAASNYAALATEDARVALRDAARAYAKAAASVDARTK